MGLRRCIWCSRMSTPQGFPSLRRVPFRFPPPATFCFTSGCGAFTAWSHTDTTSPVWCVCTRGWMEDGVECIVVQHFWQHVQGSSIASRVFYRGLAGASQAWQGVCKAIGRRAELPEARRPIWPSTEGSAIHFAFSTTTPKAPKAACFERGLDSAPPKNRWPSCERRLLPSESYER